jgi:hypothetical protein
MRLFILLLMALLLCFFTFGVIKNSGVEDTHIPDIAEMLPKEIGGWEANDMPVGETEEVKRKMGQILDYDSAIYREYKKGFKWIQVYISFWRRGKTHLRTVYGHSPDVCWTRAGWEPTLRDGNHTFTLDFEPEFRLKTAQYREFSLGTSSVRVLFWQLLDGEPFSYGNFGEPPVTAIFTDIFSRGFNQKPEQWFIRISSNVDFDLLKTDSGFETLIRSLEVFELQDTSDQNQRD